MHEHAICGEEVIKFQERNGGNIFQKDNMKYKVSILFTFIADEQENYDSLIEEGYLPDEAEQCIKDSFYEMSDRIDNRADNVIYFPYFNECTVEKID